jgi:hypothetical protein
VNNDNVKSSETHHVALVEMVEMNPCMFPGRVNPASGKSCRNREGFDGMPATATATEPSSTIKEKTPDIYNQQYSLVSENGESIGIYEMGSLAGSSGVAYQTSQRSPLSYNIDLQKSSPMTELSFGKFGRGDVEEDATMNAREVIHQHNANVSSFHNKPVVVTSEASDGERNRGDGDLSYYDELIQQLSKLFDGHTADGSGEDLSDIRGDMLSQVYYYGITAVLLYLLYRVLYVKRK